MNNYNIHNIPGGARAILIPNNSRELCCVSVLVRCGSRNEPKKYHGLSHYLEHMVFKATVQYPELGDISRELDRIGADYNASTSKNTTNYYICNLVSEKVKTAIDILSSMVLEPLLEKEHMENEKNVVVEELNQVLDNHIGISASLVTEEIFKNTNLENDTIGTTNKILNLKHEDLVGYYRSHYRLDNIVIAVSGNFEDSIINHIIERFDYKRNRLNYGLSNIHQKKYMSHSYKLKDDELLTNEDFFYYPKYLNKIHTLTLDTGGTLRICQNETLKQCAIYIAFPTHGFFSEQQYFSTINELILGGNMSSRLYQQLRDDNGLVYSVNVDSSLYYESGAFCIFCSGDLEKLEKILTIITKNLYEMKNNFVTETEYEFNLEHIHGKIISVSDNLMSTANFYGSQLMFDKSILTFDDLLKKKYSKKYITREKLNAIIDDIFDFSKIVISIVGNIDNNEILSTVNNIINQE